MDLPDTSIVINEFEGKENFSGTTAQNLQHLVEGICKGENMGYATVSRDNIITSANTKLAELFSKDIAKSAVGMNLVAYLETLELRLGDKKIALDVHDIVSRFKARLFRPEPQKVKAEAITSDGRHIRINCWFPGGAFDEMVMTVRDISKQSRYRRLFDISMQAAKAGFWSIDFASGKFTYSDTVLERLTEEEVQRMKTIGVWSIVHPDDREYVLAEWQKVFKTGEDFDLKYRVQIEKFGIMWQQSIGQIERAPSGRVLAATAFVMDVTEGVSNQERLIQEQETSQAKSNFLARMSHEIRTPLNAIIGMSDSLRDETLTPDVRGVIDDIEDAAEGLNNLLSRTLDHAKLISKKMQINLEEVNPRSVLEACQRLWRPQITSKGLNFKVAIDPKLPETLHLDEFRIQQCVNNLLSNAVKFTSEGSISLIMRMADVKGQSRLVIAVRDEGIGMTADEAARIFDDFTQADESISREFGGTGLGMSITKQLSELMGGHIHVKSEKGVGTTFMLVLPADAQETQALQSEVSDRSAAIERSYAQPPETQTLEAVSPQDLGTQVSAETQPVADSVSQSPAIIAPVDLSDAADKPFHGLNVLCVEDNPVNQKVVNRLIGNRVKQIHFANNGREALNVLNTAPIDVVLMDIHMPIMDGIETTMEIRRSNSAYANVIIIALTADPDYQQKRICKNIGMDDTIGKPVRREDILNAFDRNLGHLSENFGQKVKLSA